MTTHLTPNRTLGISGSLWDPETLRLPHFAFPGGAEISFVCRDGSLICWGCAEEQISERLSYVIEERSEYGDRTIPEMLSEEDPSDLIGLDLSSERDSCSSCDQCSRVIPSAYCDPESDPSEHCETHRGAREALSQEPESDPEPEDLGERFRSWVVRLAEGDPERYRLSEIWDSERIYLYLRSSSVGISEESPSILTLCYRGGSLDLRASSALAWDASRSLRERYLFWDPASDAPRSEERIWLLSLAAVTRLDPLRFCPREARSLGWSLLEICESLRYWEGDCDPGDLWGSAMELSFQICSLLDLRDRGDLIPERMGYRASILGAEISPGIQSLAVYRSETLGALLPALSEILDRARALDLDY